MSGPGWFEAGLRFRCTRCGHCCTGSPGTVAVSEAEIARLAERLELRESDFREVYTRRLRGGAVSLRERANGDCVFWDRGRGCGVYADRPRQCRTWPFWHAVVHSPERWAEEAAGCPGMDRGPLHPAPEIRALCEDDGTLGG